MSNYYVSQAGSDGAAGTEGAPFRNIQFALNLGGLTAGDTIYVMNGTYLAGPAITDRHEWYAHGGSAGNPITLTAYPGHRPAIVGPIQLSTNADYCTVSNLTIIGGPFVGGSGNDGVGIQVDVCDNVTIQDCHILNTNCNGIYLGGATNALIQRNYLYRNGINKGHGIYFHHGTDGVIINNVIDLAYDFGIQLYPSPSDVLVAFNTIVRSGQRNHTGGGGAGLVLSGEDLIIANNIIAHNLENAILTLIAPSDSTLTGSGNKAINNIYYDNSAQDYQKYLEGTGYSNDPPAGPNTGNTNTDPLFNSTADFRLQGGSPAIAFGSATYTQVLDFYGRTRSGQTVGAYEKIRTGLIKV